MNSRILRLDIYLYFCYISFAFLLFYFYRPLQVQELLPIIVFSAISVFFEINEIVLPSGENLSLISPILLTVSLTMGFFPLLSVITLTTLIIMIKNINRIRKWFIAIFNGIQYAISAIGGLLAFELVKEISGNKENVYVVGFLVYIAVFFLLNVAQISTYLFLRNGRESFEVIKMLFEKRSILLYFTVMLLGLLMSTLIEENGLIAVPILAFILWGLGSTYRHYYTMSEHFKSLSTKDELTGLYNHRHFQETLHKLVEDNQELSLLLLDLDHFKVYNDLFGHPAGDRLLKQLAELLIENIPDGVNCRYGGEEFAIILPKADSDKALEIAEKIRNLIASTPFEGVEHMPSKKITASIGVSTYPEQANKKEELIMLADQALYRVKYTSRNKVQLYTSVIDELKSKFEMSDHETEIIHMVKSFLTIINSKDRYTYGHTERVMQYAEALAIKIGASEEEIKNIKYAALLHDIGKVEVPSEVLTKKGRLTAEEWEKIKMHVIWGEQIVEPINDLEECLPLIRHHHERFDGTGYPDQLKGEQIPLGARILTIVDSFDAMTTNRPYQSSKSLSQAIEEIQRCAGIQFDPQLVEPFIEVLREIRPEQIELGA